MAKDKNIQISKHLQMNLKQLKSIRINLLTYTDLKILILLNLLQACALDYDSMDALKCNRQTFNYYE